MKKNMMYLYYCKACGVLLMRVEKKLISYGLGELDDNGDYVHEEESDAVTDCYLCPNCDNSTAEDETEQHKLGSICIPISVAETLLELWERVREECRGDCHMYGIQLGDPELKEILTVELL